MVVAPNACAPLSPTLPWPLTASPLLTRPPLHIYAPARPALYWRAVSQLHQCLTDILPVISNSRNTVNKYNNNNINNNIVITEELTHYDANHCVISQTQVTKVINKSVKFLDEDTMNANLTASQPLMNGHLRPESEADSNMADSQKLANSQPHVTISSHLTPKEDRAFRTKIDK